MCVDEGLHTKRQKEPGSYFFQPESYWPHRPVRRRKRWSCPYISRLPAMPRQVPSPIPLQSPSSDPTCEYSEVCWRDALEEHDGKCILHSEKPSKDEEAFEKALEEHREEYERDFRWVVFPSETDFSDVTFERRVEFQSDTFEGKANFSGAAFKGEADFDDVYFEDTSFYNATFKEEVYFTGTAFREAIFTRATFEKKGSFRLT